MSLINNMEMASALFKKSYIKIEKAFFGLKTKIIYTLTNSPVVGDYLEYDRTCGAKVKYLLDLPTDQLQEALKNEKHLEPVANGMYSLSLCYSKDHRFAAFLLSRYIEFDYCPVSEVRFVQGDDAEALLRTLVR